MKYILLGLSIVALSANAFAGEAQQEESSGLFHLNGVAVTAGYAMATPDAIDSRLNGWSFQINQDINENFSISTGFADVSGTETSNVNTKAHVDVFETRFDLKAGQSFHPSSYVTVHPYVMGGGVMAKVDAKNSSGSDSEYNFGGEVGAGLSVAIQKHFVIDASYNEQFIKGTQNGMLVTEVGYKF
ncbi:hypothetical protein BCT04_15275 [Vibrio breoganii]|uniref:outer membrane beta-barrel protein n=1 Tax=Vibrio breoganii TaxID=553239 RepID=UPI000C81E635|nr:outer membrane beta-barrel protein [Vibrio breoganii]PMG05185.1 hypothetical protein BCV00_13460 [Vibrio breoganii]PMK30710.1 hypothetical protein BCU03_08760 [Vibrio breoganii]PMO63708.1 hypothetical protein BCT04_15275 [Vibrio breoganii]